MTRRTTNALLHVDAMVEIDEIRHIVDPIPFERLAGSQALPHRREQGSIRPNLGMATHARLGRRNSGEGRTLDCGMAIPAINA